MIGLPELKTFILAPLITAATLYLAHLLTQDMAGVLSIPEKRRYSIGLAGLCIVISTCGWLAAAPLIMQQPLLGPGTFAVREPCIIIGCIAVGTTYMSRVSLRWSKLVKFRWAAMAGGAGLILSASLLVWCVCLTVWTSIALAYTDSGL